MNGTDPWLSGGDADTDSVKAFEDNFQPDDKLPDSDEYLAILEKKLAGLKERRSKKDLVKSLEETRKSCMLRLLADDSTVSSNQKDLSLDTPINSNSSLLRHIAPERQALTIGELVELLKADQLSEILAEDSASDSENKSDK